MEIKLGKWEKGGMQRIYFNAPALGSSKVYAYANKNGGFEIGEYKTTTAYNDAMYKAADEGTKLIEKLIGKPISYDTKFADVWSAIGA